MTKPPAEKRVLAWDGKQWVRAIWVERYTKEAPHDDEFDDYDYCEAYDEHFWFEGWYEVQSHGGEEMLWHITDGVQEWREMPPAPGSDHAPDAGNKVSEAQLWAEIARLRFDLEKATESRKLAQQALYDARERFQKEVSARTSEISRLLKERQDCEPIYQFRKAGSGCPEWHDGHPDPTDGGGPYETRTLYAAPPKREPLSSKEVRYLMSVAGYVDATPQEKADFINGVRFAERGHCIEGKS